MNARDEGGAIQWTGTSGPPNALGLPTGSSIPTGYSTVVKGENNRDFGVQSYVTCFDNPPAHVP